MAVELIKPDPADEPGDATAADTVADVIELVPDGDQADEGAADTSRLRALLDLAQGEFRQAMDERHDPPAREQGRAPRALAAPSVWSLRHYVFHLGGFRAVRVGSVVMWRKGQAARGKGKASKAKAPAAKPSAAKAGQAAPAPTGKGKGKGKAKAAKQAAAAPAPAAGKQGMTFQGAIAGLLTGGMVMTAVAKEIKIVSLVVIILVIIWVPVAWLVGGFVLAGEQRKDAAEQGDKDGDDGPGEQDEDGEAADAADALGETDGQAAASGGEVVDEGAERDAARVRTYAWVRSQIAAGNGRAVHLRTLLWKASQEPGGEGLTMADVRAGLEGHGVTIRPQVKALCPDDPKVPAGVEKNRPGVHRDGLPQGYTPVETPGSTLIRLLPDLQAPDLQ